MVWLSRAPISSAASLLWGALAFGCTVEAELPAKVQEDDLQRGRHYAESESYRRTALEASLTNPDNGYSRLRLENYRDDRWGALPLWMPAVRSVSTDDLASAPPSAGFSALDVDAVDWTEAALLELGRRAFFEYPIQIMSFTAGALTDSDAPARYGLWQHDGTVGGLAWTSLPGDALNLSVTCSTCHATVVDGALAPGKNAAALDLSRLASEFHGGGPGSVWGAGRLDVTSDGSDNPVAIPDLRPVRYQTHLQRAATVENDLVALAIRTEALIITSLGETVRPPRKLTFALALYLWRLELPPAAPVDAAAERGAVLFHDGCADCHRPPSFSGPAVPLEEIGTDPSVGLSSERGTGTYRVPSLRGVGDRRPLFTTGAVGTLEELLAPTRAAVGHDHGLDLDEGERSDLVAYLRTL